MTLIQKIAAYGFSTYKDMDEAQEAIWLSEQNPDAFAPQLYLSSISSTDRDYSNLRINNDKLSKIDKKWGVSQYAKTHPGFIEERPGYKKQKDIYLTREGANGLADYIRSKANATPEEMSEALYREGEIRSSMESMKSQHIKRQQSLAERVRDKLNNYEISKNMNAIGRLYGTKDLIEGKVLTGVKKHDEFAYRQKIDKKLKELDNTSLGVSGTRFADAIDAAVSDDNELFSFKHY